MVDGALSSAYAEKALSMGKYEQGAVFGPWASSFS